MSVHQEVREPLDESTRSEHPFSLVNDHEVQFGPELGDAQAAERRSYPAGEERQGGRHHRGGGDA